MKKLLLALCLIFAAVTPAAAQQSAQPLLCNKVSASAGLAAGTTQLVAGVANQIITVCGWARDENANGTVQLVFGTGSTCTTPTSVSSTWTVLTNTHTVNHVPYGYISSLPGQSLCAIVTGTGTILSIETYYLQTP